MLHSPNLPLVLFPRCLIIVLSAILAQQLFAQSSRRDSTFNHYDSLGKAKQAQFDKTSNRTNYKIDSVQATINKLVKPDFKSLNQSRERRKERKDSIAFQQQLILLKQCLRKKIDSLDKLGEPTQHYSRQLDSLNKVSHRPRSNKMRNLSNINQSTLKQELNQKKDRHDSIQFYEKIAKEKAKIQRSINKATQEKQPTDNYSHQLDSLNKLTFTPSNSNKKKGLNESISSIGASAAKLNSKMDSTDTQFTFNKMALKVESKAAAVDGKINAPINKIEDGVSTKLTLMNKEGGKEANLPANASLPQAELPNMSLSNGNSIAEVSNAKPGLDNPLKDQLGKEGELNKKIVEAGNIPSEQISKVKSVEGIENAQVKLAEANTITDKAQGYGQDVKNISKGDLREVKELSKTAEEKVNKIGALKDLQKETGQFDEHKQLVDKAKNPELMKDEVLRKAPMIAVNHFAGKQEVLQSAMDKMSSLKSKYESLNSLTDIPKRRRNTMYGKPFIERLLPGITFQIQRSSDFLLDYNPYVGYRFYGRFTAGLGWNERIGIRKYIHFSLKERIYGPRVFANFLVGKGFSVRTDIEKMNTFVPALTGPGYSTTDGYRAWMWSAFVGIRKEYKFVKGVKGTTQFLYNLYDDHNNSPYSDRIVVRVGFEFPIKKKPKQFLSTQH